MQKKPTVRWDELVARYDAALDWLHRMGLNVAGSRFAEGRRVIVEITGKYPHAGYDRPLVRDPIARKFARCLDDAIEFIHVAEAFERLPRSPMGIKPRLKEMLGSKEASRGHAFDLLVAALFETAAYTVDLRETDLWATWPGEPSLAVENRRVTTGSDLALAIRTASTQLERRARSREQVEKVLVIGIGRSNPNDPLVSCTEGRGAMARESQSRAYDFFNRHREFLGMELGRAEIGALVLVFAATFGAPMKNDAESWFTVTPYLDMELRPGRKDLEESPFILNLQRRLSRAVWRLSRDGAQALPTAH